MGNDHSHLSSIEIEEKSVEVSDFWSHHSASIVNLENTTNLSVLIGDLFVYGPLWKTHTPLEKNSKNLMLFRHPNILKYISSWNKNSKFYLAVEEVVPLSHALPTQSPLQICIGLNLILKALCFLHEKAFVSHNNVCSASIYVTKDGSWKLGSMEYACKFSELSSDYLKKSRSNRYDKAIDPNEETHIQGCSRRDFVDVYAYGVLAIEVLKSGSDEDVLSWALFRELCKEKLQDFNVAARPKFSSLLQHEFFSHDFIAIHSFLTELPVKSDEEKSIFFQSLLKRLRVFPEISVASQFGNLLLCRLVLLNKTAQDKLLPFLLCPQDAANTNNLFTEGIFKKFLAPKLLEIFCVRDAQIRLLLLNYFKHFLHIFTKEELQSCILPELLVGVKDTNDYIVAATLRTLADLIPVLGSATVIGGKRGRLFTDGRPVRRPYARSRSSSKMPEVPPSIPESAVPNPIVLTDQVLMDLPERPRPDGEEGETETEEAEQSVEGDLDNWEDWDEANARGVENVTSVPLENVLNTTTLDSEERSTVQEGKGESLSNCVRRMSLPDINELDIKNQTSSKEHDEFNFFQDMEPVIEAASKYLVDGGVNVSQKLKLEVTEDQNEDGWGEEEW